MIRLVKTLFVGAAGLALAGTCSLASAAPTVDPQLASRLSAAPLTPAPAVITFDSHPDPADLLALHTLGMTGGIVLNELPMVLTQLNAAQLDALDGRSDIVSIYGLRFYEAYTNASRKFIGVDAMMRDAELAAANSGLPVSGDGIGVAYVDTGIDTAHPDLNLGENVVQNVYFPLGEVQTGITGISIELPPEFVPPVFVEDVPNTDLAGGHGTHGAGIVAGTGAASGGFYGGVAPGADLIGLMAGNDLGLTNFSILQAYDYALVNQFRYNIRIANNSFGGDLGDPSNYNPDDPLLVATRELHDRFITVVFAAGNSGSDPGAINYLSVAPWVISVAAGTKQGLGTPADFSSRGEDDGTGTDVAGQPADPAAPPNFRPDLTAPGEDIKSARAVSVGLTNTAGTLIGNDVNSIPPAFLVHYTTSQGTSFAAPHVSGVVALMLEANPALTPDDVVTILRGAATPMEPFTERVVGAGYLDAHNAVRAAVGFAGVDHPFDLTHVPGDITDPEGDNSGTTAHDVLDGGFGFDDSTGEITFEMTVADIAPGDTNHRWTMEFVVGGATVFVGAERTLLGDEFEWGTVAPDPNTGVNTQTNRGQPDSAVIEGNTIRWRLAAQRVSDALGFDVVGEKGSAIAANAWTLIGTSFTGGLLLRADVGLGADFVIGGGDGDGDGGGGEIGNCPEGGFTERLSGSVPAERGSSDVFVVVRCESVDAQINYHPGSQNLSLELFDGDGNLRATGDAANGRKLSASGLEPGAYRYHISGPLTKDVDFTIRSTQE